MTSVRRAFLFLVASVLLGAVASEAVSSRERELRSMVGAPVPVLVTARQVSEGETFGAGNLSVREVPSRWAPRPVLGRPRQAWGMVAATKLPAGSFLGPGTWRDPADRAADALGDAERIATVVAAAPPGSVMPGSRVDVVVTTGDSRPRLAMRGVEVLAVRRAPEGATGPGHAVEADLRTDVAGAIRLAQASGEDSGIRLLPIGGRS